jgi:hypothetical protein
MIYSPNVAPTGLIAAASRVLSGGGYQEIRQRAAEWDSSTSRIFEDPYNIVGVVVFDTCSELVRKWSDYQQSLVDVISRYVGKTDSKSWDGYLVLLTPSAASTEQANLEVVRYDTTRLRKIVASGDDVSTPTDVERVLRPLLPLAEEQVKRRHESALDLLPDLLAAKEIPRATTKLLIEAFREQSPLLERLHGERN